MNKEMGERCICLIEINEGISLGKLCYLEDIVL